MCSSSTAPFVCVVCVCVLATTSPSSSSSSCCWPSLLIISIEQCVCVLICEWIRKRKTEWTLKGNYKWKEDPSTGHSFESTHFEYLLMSFTECYDLMCFSELSTKGFTVICNSREALFTVAFHIYRLHFRIILLFHKSQDNFLAFLMYEIVPKSWVICWLAVCVCVCPD